MAHYFKSHEWTRPNQAKRMKSGPKRAKKRQAASAARSPALFSRKTVKGDLKHPVSGKTVAKYKVKPSKRHGSFPTSWSTSITMADPLGQKG